MNFFYFVIYRSALKINAASELKQNTLKLYKLIKK
jgi:hypothetical protein